MTVEGDLTVIAPLRKVAADLRRKNDEGAREMTVLVRRVSICPTPKRALSGG